MKCQTSFVGVSMKEVSLYVPDCLMIVQDGIAIGNKLRYGRLTVSMKNIKLQLPETKDFHVKS